MITGYMGGKLSCRPGIVQRGRAGRNIDPAILRY